MKMQSAIEDYMPAPCGMNCAVYYKRAGMRKRGKSCAGCLRGDERKTERCRSCGMKLCALLCV